jgi:FkbM family methyltransferase
VSALKHLANALPSPIRKIAVNSYRQWRGIPEDLFLKMACDPSKTSIDIGANAGHLTRLMAAHSKRCIAFEPVPDVVDRLRADFSSVKNVEIYDCALSDSEGEVTLRIPIEKIGFKPQNASIETSDLTVSKYRNKEVIVPKKKLDQFDFGPVAVIKTDVEGHEEAVLRGAMQTIERYRPVVTAELDEIRHKPGCIGNVVDLFKGLSYKTFFIDGRRIVPFDRFDIGVHQNKNSLDENDVRIAGKTYVDMFLFVSEEAPLAQRISGLSL